MREKECNIPNLFPSRLLDICEERVLSLLRTAGNTVVRNSKQQSRYSSWNSYQLLIPSNSLSSSLISRAWPDWLVSPPSSNHYTNSQVFLENTQICREFLSAFLAGPVLDSLAQQAKQKLDVEVPESLFIFTVLCGDRLGRLVVHQHTDQEKSRDRAWAKFILSPEGNPLLLSCLSQLSSLSSLYMQYVADNDLLYIVSTVCSKLVLLDISYSQNVTDIGLVHLCGVLKVPPGSVQSGPRGCKYLRELYFNPQSSIEQELIMPRVTACLLRHLPMLQVVDLSNLHSGINHYYRGSRESFQRQSRVKPLNLVHYTGSDKLAEVMDICPKLRTFKLFVTEQLPELGETLKGLHHSLDQVTLVYSPLSAQDQVDLGVNEDDIEQVQHGHLTGIQEFLAACGSKISRLEVDCSQDTIVTKADLMSITTHCPQLESLAFTNFHVELEVDRRIEHSPIPSKPAYFPFLNHVRLNNVTIDEFGKEVFRYLLGGALDLETINISFFSPGYFFSDFLLDDILLMNEFAHLQKFSFRGGALTLISALRLISSRPKLRTIGELLHWDVEPSELETFIQILRRARSLNLLQDIHIY